MVQLLLAIIYLGFVSLGLPDALLGSAWPTMYQEFGVPVSFAGGDRKSTRLNSSHGEQSRMPSSA